MPVPLRACGVAALCLIGLFPAAAGANVISHEITLDNGGAGYAAGEGGAFLLPQFDDQLGARRLCWMALSVTATANGGSIVLDNETPGLGGVASVAIGARATVASNTSLTPLAVTATPQAVHTGWLAGDDPAETGPGTPQGPYLLNADFAGPDSLSATLQTATRQEFITLDAADYNLSEFVGTGVVAFRFDSELFQQVQHDLPAWQQECMPPDFALRVQLIYGMEVGVPEPATVAMLAAGGVLILRRRSRRP